MVALSTKDSAILTRVAQFDRLSDADREAMLVDASETARAIGRAIIGKSNPKNADVRHAARVLRSWADKNRNWSRQRKVRRNRAR